MNSFKAVDLDVSLEVDCKSWKVAFITWFGGPQQSWHPPLAPSQQIRQQTPKPLSDLVTEVWEAGFLGIVCFALI